MRRLPCLWVCPLYWLWSWLDIYYVMHINHISMSMCKFFKFQCTILIPCLCWYSGHCWLLNLYPLFSSSFPKELQFCTSREVNSIPVFWSEPYWSIYLQPLRSKSFRNSHRRHVEETSSYFWHQEVLMWQQKQLWPFCLHKGNSLKIKPTHEGGYS